MKLVILGVLLATLIAAAPTAFAQQSSGKTSDQQMQDKSAKKSAHARKHEGKTVGAKPATPDFGQYLDAGREFRQRRYNSKVKVVDATMRPPLEGGLSKRHPPAKCCECR